MTDPTKHKVTATRAELRAGTRRQFTSGEEFRAWLDGLAREEAAAHADDGTCCEPEP